MGVNEAKNYFFFENFAIHRVKKEVLPYITIQNFLPLASLI